MHTPLLDIAPTDLVDIAVVALLLWGLVVWTRRARMALLGLAFLGVFYYLIAQQFKLQLTTWILQGFFAALVVVVVVVFQDDLRRLFEQIATLSLRRKAPRPDPSSLGTLTRGLYQLAVKRRGALVVLPGREPIERHFLQHGVPLDAEISEELLDSLFDPGSAGHDGALVMENNRVKEFGVHLPLSENRDELKGGGTRHAAALGLAEHSDALCLVVSEERGTIGIATRGQLEILDNPDAGKLADRIRSYLQHGDPSERTPREASVGAASSGRSFVLRLGLGRVASLRTGRNARGSSAPGVRSRREHARRICARGR